MASQTYDEELWKTQQVHRKHLLSRIDNIFVHAQRLPRTISSQPSKSSTQSTAAHNALITPPPPTLELRQNNAQDCQNLIIASVDRATVEISRTIIALNATFSQQLQAASISASNGIKAAQNSATSTINIVIQSASVATVAAFSSVTFANRAVTSANLALTSAQASASTALSVANESMTAATSSLALINLALRSAQASLTSVSSSSSSDISNLQSSLTLLQSSVSSIQASAISAIAAAQSALASVTGSAAAQASAILASAASTTQNLQSPQTVSIGSPSTNRQPLESKSPTKITLAQAAAITVGTVIVSFLLSAVIYLFILKKRKPAHPDRYSDEKAEPTGPKELPTKRSSIRHNPTASSSDLRTPLEVPLSSKSEFRRHENEDLNLLAAENTAKRKAGLLDKEVIGMALRSPSLRNWPLKMDQSLNLVERGGIRTPNVQQTEDPLIDGVAAQQLALNPFGVEAEQSSILQPVFEVTHDCIEPSNIATYCNSLDINPFEDPDRGSALDIRNPPLFGSAEGAAISEASSPEIFTSASRSIEVVGVLPQIASQTPVTKIAGTVIDGVQSRTPETNPFLQIIAPEYTDSPGKSLFESHFRTPMLEGDLRVTPSSEHSSRKGQNRLSSIYISDAMITDHQTEWIESSLEHTLVIHNVVEPKLVPLSPRSSTVTPWSEDQQQPSTSQDSKISQPQTILKEQDVTPMLETPRKSEADQNYESETRGRSMIRNSDIIEARLSYQMRMKNAEKAAEENIKRIEDRTISPLRRNPVDTSVLFGQMRKKSLLSVQQSVSNGQSVKRRPRTVSPSKTRQFSSPKVRSRTEPPIPRHPESISRDTVKVSLSNITLSPLRRNPSVGPSLRVAENPTISMSKPISKLSPISGPASNTAFSQTLSKFRNLAAQNAIEGRQASTEVTQRAIAGIYIPGSLREQAVRNLSRSRDRVKATEKTSKKMAKPGAKDANV